MTLFSRIVGYRCPNCAELQPAFALLTTVNGGALMTQLNPNAPCLNCGAKLRLVSATFSMRLVGSLVSLLMALALFGSAATLLATLAGKVGFLTLVVSVFIWLTIFAYLFGALRARLLRHILTLTVETP